MRVSSCSLFCIQGRPTRQGVMQAREARSTPGRGSQTRCVRYYLPTQVQMAPEARLRVPLQQEIRNSTAALLGTVQRKKVSRKYNTHIRNIVQCHVTILNSTQQYGSSSGYCPMRKVSRKYNTNIPNIVLCPVNKLNNKQQYGKSPGYELVYVARHHINDGEENISHREIEYTCPR